MPTMQDKFLEYTTILNQPDSAYDEYQRWMNLHAHQVRHYHNAPTGANGTTIEFTDGTAVTVLTKPHEPFMEVHRGRAHDPQRHNWLSITPDQPASRQQMHEIHAMPRIHPIADLADSP